MDLDYNDICIRGNRRLSRADCDLLYTSSLEIKPKVILEIGSADGTSSMVFANVAKQTGGHLYCIDPRPKKRWYDNMKELGLEEYVTMIPAYSPWVKDGLVPEEIDYLFVDGEHKMPFAYTDFHYWGRFVAQNGRIAFHDIFGPVSNQIWGAIEIINKYFPNKLKEVGRCPSAPNRGVIVYEKLVKGLF